MRIEVQQTDAGTVRVSIHDFETDEPVSVNAPVMDRPGELVFSITGAPGQTIYLRAHLLDGDTLGIWQFNARRDRYEHMHACSRSALTQGADLEAHRREFQAIRQEELREFQAREVEKNVAGIRTAQLAYDAAFDKFQATEVWPRSVENLDPEPVAWGRGSAFDPLGWAPRDDVVGCYKVEVEAGGEDFTVHGWADMDGDGVPAHWTATRERRATRQTAEGVR